MSIDVRVFEGDALSGMFSDILVLSRQVFGEMKEEYLRWRLDNQPDVTMFLASEAGVLIGFKVGYAMSHRRYYSWLGGVCPAQRKQGVASLLMQAQHGWLTKSPYEVVETHVRKDNLSMVGLNTRFGFETTGTYLREGNENYIMQKSIDRQE